MKITIDLDGNSPSFQTDPEERVRVAERALANALASIPTWFEQCHNEGTIIDVNSGYITARWRVDH